MRLKTLTTIGVLSGAVIIAAAYVNTFIGIARVLEERRTVPLNDFEYDRAMGLLSANLTMGQVMGGLVMLGSATGYILIRMQKMKLQIFD